MLKVLC